MSDSVPSPPRSPSGPLSEHEFRVLRDTIRERGTWRVALAVLGLALWALIHLVVQIWIPAPIAFLVPLLVLAATFEGIFALHVGVERIGRFLEVVYERDPLGPRWEQTAHGFGRQASDPAGRLDPLFALFFMGATVLNLVPVVLLVAAGAPAAAGWSELAVYGCVHLVLLVRIGRARRFAARQRAQELALFSRLTGPDESN